MLKSSYPDGMNEILVAAILWELLQGLEYLHKMGIIHRWISLHILHTVVPHISCGTHKENLFNNQYHGTGLIQTSTGHAIVSVLAGCLC